MLLNSSSKMMNESFSFAHFFRYFFHPQHFRVKMAVAFVEISPAHLRRNRCRRGCREFQLPRRNGEAHMRQVEQDAGCFHERGFPRHIRAGEEQHVTSLPKPKELEYAFIKPEMPHAPLLRKLSAARMRLWQRKNPFRATAPTAMYTL